MNVTSTTNLWRILNVPSDAKPDWALAAKEVRTLLEAEGFEF